MRFLIILTVDENILSDLLTLRLQIPVGLLAELNIQRYTHSKIKMPYQPILAYTSS